jgi:hypothetical protein
MIPDYFGELQKLWENLFKVQTTTLETISSALENLVKLNVMQENVAVFRAKIQSGGRVSIPEAERTALNLNEGDVVKVIIVKERGGE